MEKELKKKEKKGGATKRDPVLNDSTSCSFICSRMLFFLLTPIKYDNRSFQGRPRTVPRKGSDPRG